MRTERCRSARDPHRLMRDGIFPIARAMNQPKIDVEVGHQDRQFAEVVSKICESGLNGGVAVTLLRRTDGPPLPPLLRHLTVHSIPTVQSHFKRLVAGAPVPTREVIPSRA